jgi:hypothetical protein
MRRRYLRAINKANWILDGNRELTCTVQVYLNRIKYLGNTVLKSWA